MEWFAWLLTNIRFAFFYMVNIIAGNREDEHYNGKEKTITEWKDEDE